MLPDLFRAPPDEVETRHPANRCEPPPGLPPLWSVTTRAACRTFTKVKCRPGLQALIKRRHQKMQSRNGQASTLVWGGGRRQCCVQSGGGGADLHYIVLM